VAQKKYASTVYTRNGFVADKKTVKLKIFHRGLMPLTLKYSPAAAKQKLTAVYSVSEIRSWFYM